jgi:hypothetical protein
VLQRVDLRAASQLKRTGEPERTTDGGCGRWALTLVKIDTANSAAYRMYGTTFFCVGRSTSTVLLGAKCRAATTAQQTTIWMDATKPGAGI